MPPRSPNFLFIGPDKSGSTWLYETLRHHPLVFLPPVKELFFFDQFYDKGWPWYGKYFRNAGERHRVIGEICHDYLFSQLACQRIAHDLPSAKLMVCLREPCSRAFSEYLYRIKVGDLACDFETALEKSEDLIYRSCYSQHLSLYFNYFKRDQIFVAIFDDLLANPRHFFDTVCVFLGLESMPLPPRMMNKVLPAAMPRLPVLAKYARSIGWQLRQWGSPRIVGKIKESTVVNRILYRSYESNKKPRMSSKSQEFLHKVFAPDVRRLDALLGTDLSGRWGYRGE